MSGTQKREATVMIRGGHIVRYVVINGEYVHLSGLYSPESTGAHSLRTYKAWLTRHGISD